MTQNRLAVILDLNYVDNIINSRVLSEYGFNVLKTFTEKSKALDFLSNHDQNQGICIFYGVSIPDEPTQEINELVNELKLININFQIILLVYNYTFEEIGKNIHMDILHIEKPLTVQKLTNLLTQSK